MHLLRLGGCGGLAGAYRPNGLVRDYKTIKPLSWHGGVNRFELLLHDFEVLTGLALVKRFSHTIHSSHVIGQYLLHFSRKLRIALPISVSTVLIEMLSLRATCL